MDLIVLTYAVGLASGLALGLPWRLWCKPHTRRFISVDYGFKDAESYAVAGTIDRRGVVRIESEYREPRA